MSVSIKSHQELVQEMVSAGRNPLSIQVCFNAGSIWQERIYVPGRNPLSIQVCFNHEFAHGKLILPAKS